VYDALPKGVLALMEDEEVEQKSLSPLKAGKTDAELSAEKELYNQVVSGTAYGMAKPPK
jgi:hypothetical protein